MSKHGLILTALALACTRPPAAPARADRRATLAVRTEPGAKVVLDRLGPGGVAIESWHGVATAAGLWIGVALPRGDYRLAGRAAGRAHHVRYVVLWPGVSELSIAFVPEAPIAGRVLSGADPIRNATVVAVQGERRSEDRVTPDGRFRIAGLESGPVTLSAQAPGFAPLAREGLAPGEGIDLLLQPLLRLSGTVRAGSGPRKATVHVGGSGLWPPRAIGTDRQGRYAIDLVAGVYDLSAQAEGLASATIEGIEVESATTRDLELAPAAALLGSVRADDGTPVQGAVVTLGADEIQSLSRRAVSDAKGAFRLGPLIAGSYRVGVGAAGFLPFISEPVEIRPPAEARLEVALSRGALVRGKVIDATGRPVRSARIQVTVVGPDGLPRLHSQEVADSAARFLVAGGELGVTRGHVPFPSEATQAGRAFASGAAGEFRISGLPAGRATVSAQHPDFAEAQAARVDLRLDHQSDVTLVLRHGAEVAGRILDEAGYPLPGALVRARVEDRTARTALADEHGDYLLAGAVGRVHLEADLDGYLPAGQKIDLADGDRLDHVDLVLAEARLFLEGRLRDQAGLPVAGARILVRPARGPERSGRSDARGLFRIAGLPPGRAALEVTHADFPSLHGSLLPEREDEIDLTLPFGGGIEGFVRDARTREPLAAFTATCGATTAAGRRGAFVLRPLPAGRCALEITAPGYRAGHLGVAVPSGRAIGEVTLRDVLIEMDVE